jgi:hypothetical protein
MAEYLTGRQAVSRTAHHPEQSPALMRVLVTHLRHTGRSIGRSGRVESPTPSC